MYVYSVRIARSLFFYIRIHDPRRVDRAEERERKGRRDRRARVERDNDEESRRVLSPALERRLLPADRKSIVWEGDDR